MDVSILLFAALAAKAASPGIVWEPLCEPGCGGAIVSLAVSPHDPRHRVSGGDMLGTAVSFDAGETWKPGLGLPSYEMATPTFHPSRPHELWIGSCMGPFLSRDGGKTWQGRRTGMPKPCRYRYTAMIEKILIDPCDPDRLLAFGGSSRRWGTCAAMGAIWISRNGGDDWMRAGTITGEGFTTGAVKGANIVKAWWSAGADPAANVFAEGAGWFSSMDGGATWQRRKLAGLPGEPASVTTHPSDPGVVWAVLPPREQNGGGWIPGAIWRSSDGGRTFRPGDSGIRKTVRGNVNHVSRFSEIEASRARPGRLYVSDLSWSSSAVWVSDDAGATWRKGCGKSDIRTACYAGPGCRISASPTEADVAYAYNSEYVLKTADGGCTWHDATAVRPAASPAGSWRGRGWNGWCSRNVAFNPYRRGQSVVQAMDAGRGWLSDDGFRSWRYAHGGASPWCGGQGAAFSRDGSIYLTTGQNGCNNGIVVSHDGGRTWSARSGAAHGLPGCGDGEYGGVWADPDDGRRAFALFGGKRYVTADGGRSWVGEKTEKCGFFAADPTTPGRFFVKSPDGVFETCDWRSFRYMGLPGGSEGKIACDAFGRVLVCRGRTGDVKTRGLWRCDPKVGRWVRLHDDPLVSAVASDPLDPARIVLTTSDNPYHDFAGANGVFVSPDDGKTWQPANDGLHVRRLTCVAFDPFDGETLVAGTLGGGFVKAVWPRASRRRVPCSGHLASDGAFVRSKLNP